MPITEEQMRLMDEELDKQFAEEPAGDPEPEPTPEQPTQPVVEQPTPDTPPAQPVQPQKTAEDKAAHAFEQMRKQNKELQEKANAERQRVEKLERLAKESGFNSIEEFEAALEAQVIAAQAKKRNSDPATIKELQETKARLDAIERERAAQTKQQRLMEVSNEIEKLRSTRGLTPEQMTQILTEMETEGYTIDGLISQPTKTVLKIVESYATPIILEREVQTRLTKLAKDPKVPTEKPQNPTGTPQPEDWRTLLDKEMAEIEKERNKYRLK